MENYNFLIFPPLKHLQNHQNQTWFEGIKTTTILSCPVAVSQIFNFILFFPTFLKIGKNPHQNQTWFAGRKNLFWNCPDAVSQISNFISFFQISFKNWCKIKKKLILTKPALQDQNKLYLFLACCSFPIFHLSLILYIPFENWINIIDTKLHRRNSNTCFSCKLETSIELLLENLHVVHAVSFVPNIVPMNF